MALCPFLVEGQRIILQTNFYSRSPGSLLIGAMLVIWRPRVLCILWELLLLLDREEVTREQSLPHLELLFQQHGLTQLLAKHSSSLSFKNGSFVLIFFAVIFCEFSYSELGTHFPNWTLRHTPTPQITNFLKARSRCHAVTAHLEESLTTSECLCGHYFDGNVWDSRKLSFF